MPKFAVDFEIAGDVIVEADSPEEAKKKAAEMGLDQLADCICFQYFGKHYVEKAI